jgi:hypothetical protein
MCAPSHHFAWKNEKKPQKKRRRRTTHKEKINVKIDWLEIFH